MNNARNGLMERLIAAGAISKPGIDPFMFAYDLADCGHKGQTRDGGDEYISHPAACCLIMAEELGISGHLELYNALMLHDTGEDTIIFGDKDSLSRTDFEFTCVARISKIFGTRTAQLVLNLTKPKVDGKEFQDKEAMMKFYLARLNKDPEAVLLKMIDRLHNLRTLLPENTGKVRKQIAETETRLYPVFTKAIESVWAEVSLREAMIRARNAIQTELDRLKALVA